MPTRVPIVPQPTPVRGVVLIRAPRCKGCELCIEYCPVQVLELSGDFNAEGYHYPILARDGCIACRGCAAICPEFAIFAVPAGSLPPELAAAV